MDRGQDEARAFLRSVRALRSERLQAERRIEQLRTEAEHITTSYKLIGNVSGGGDQHKDALLAELADRSTELEEKIRALWRREALVDTFIERIPDARHRAILRLRYIDCLPWPKVQAALEALGFWYDERQIFRLHGAALQIARGMYPDWVKQHPELKEEETE